MDAASLQFVCTLLALPVAFTIDPVAPLLVFGICLRLGAIHDPVLLGPQFAGFAQPEFLAAVGGLYLLHGGAGKIPLLAHLQDVLGIVLKPLAIALAGLWVANRFGPQAPMHWLTLAIIAGGVPATAAAQVARTKVRLGISAATLGAALPIVSAAENAAGLGLSYLGLVAPCLAIALILAGALVLAWALSRITRAARRIADRIDAVRAGAIRRG